MKIEKTTTRHFDQYEVLTKVVRLIPQDWFDWFLRRQRTEEVEVKLIGVVEADDTTGLVVEHMRDEKGDYIYTNEADDIVVGNTEKLLLLTPFIRQAFIFNKYQPKLSRTYYKNLTIKYRGPVQPDVIIHRVESDQATEVAS